MQFVSEVRRSDSPYIEMVWRTRSEAAGPFISRAISHWEIVITQHQGVTQLTVRGPETRATVAQCPADAEFFGIQFKLGTFMPRFPISTLVDGQITLPGVTNRSFWLHGATWQLPTYENADTFIDRLVRAELLVHDPIVAAALRGQRQALSPRALQYRFVRATGLTYSAIRQIDRASQAEKLLQQGASIADTAYDAGYADQAHLTRSLKRLIGHTPAQLTRMKMAA